MKRTLAIVGTPAVAALVLLGGAPAAQAADHHHASKVEQRRHDRKVERRAARTATRPAQATAQTRDHPHGSPAIGANVVACATAGRAGSSFAVTNDCHTPQIISISVQAQPGPWHRGLCQAGGCRLLARYDIRVNPGTHTVNVPTHSACFVQVDLKWHGRLLTSNHYVNDCKPPTPKPPTPTPVPPVITQHHAPRPPLARVRLTSTPTSSAMTALPRTGFTGDVLAYVGFGSLVVGGSLLLLTRNPRRVTKAWTDAQR